MQAAWKLRGRNPVGLCSALFMLVSGTCWCFFPFRAPFKCFRSISSITEIFGQSLLHLTSWKPAKEVKTHSHCDSGRSSERSRNCWIEDNNSQPWKRLPEGDYIIFYSIINYLQIEDKDHHTCKLSQLLIRLKMSGSLPLSPVSCRRHGQINLSQ